MVVVSLKMKTHVINIIGSFMYFLSDISIASFAETKPTDKNKPTDEKVGMLKKGFRFAVGRTPMGMATRVAGLGALYGATKLKSPQFNNVRTQFHMMKMGERAKNALTSDVAKGIGASAVGTVAGGLALNEGRKLYEKKTRKWWEIL